MTRCRFYERGCCHFGDRCRFEHVSDSRNYDYKPARNYYDYKQGGNYYDYKSVGNYDYKPVGNYYDYKPVGNYDYKPVGNYYDYKPVGNYYDYKSVHNYSHYLPRYNDVQYDRYNTNYENKRNKYGSPLKLSFEDGDSSQNSYRYSENWSFSHNDQHYSRSGHFPQDYQSSGNAYSQNQFQWRSGDYKKVHQKYPDSKSEVYKASTPKGSSFSFKVPDSEIKHSSSYHVTAEDGLYTEIVKEDALAWESSGWPFTCYAPYSGKFGFPEFRDISPEELRYSAYKAKENNVYEAYVNAVQNNIALVKQYRDQLKFPNPVLLNKLKRIKSGEKLQAESNTYVSIPFLEIEECPTKSMDDVDSSSSVSAAAFSFKVPASEIEPVGRTSSSTFSFKLPVGSESKSSDSRGVDGDPTIYTPFNQLTDEEKEQFQASTFVLGKIPTRPPPLSFCT